MLIETKTKQFTNNDLIALANNIRCSALVAIHSAKSGHPGGALSCADLLANLYGCELRGNLMNDPDRDRFILSKGHACPALYAAGAEMGYIKYADLLRFRQLDSLLQGHPHVITTPWVETSTGSLGQGFSVAIGMALGLRYQKKSVRIYVMLGDGECQEGEVWEGALFASHNKLDNLCAIIDYNKLQSDDTIENIIALEPFADKWQSFGWHVIEIDGHAMEKISDSLDEAKNIKNKPTMIIAHTVKGKGVEFMEQSTLWHGSVTLRDEELKQALVDLGTSQADIDYYFSDRIWKR